MAERFYKIFDSVLEDKNLTYPEVILYGVIVRLSMNSSKKCFASNGALAKIMRCSKSSIGKWLGTLTKQGYIQRSIHYVDGTKNVDKRYIMPVYPALMQEGIPQDNNRVLYVGGIRCSPKVEGSIPYSCEDSNINIVIENSNINEKENIDNPPRSNNFFLNLASKGNDEDLF